MSIITRHFRPLISPRCLQTKWFGLYTLFLAPKTLCLQRISFVDVPLTTLIVLSRCGRVNVGHIGRSHLSLIFNSVFKWDLLYWFVLWVRGTIRSNLTHCNMAIFYKQVWIETFHQRRITVMPLERQDNGALNRLKSPVMRKTFLYWNLTIFQPLLPARIPAASDREPGLCSVARALTKIISIGAWKTI